MSYGNFDKFLITFAPDKQRWYCSCPENKERCFSGTAPTLTDLRLGYGESAPSMWLAPQLDDIAIFSNSKNNLSREQIIMLADMIATNYHYFKITELMVYFWQFKMGKYGMFYGSVDPMKIMNGLTSFRDERGEILSQIKQQQDDMKREQERKNSVTKEIYRLHRNAVLSKYYKGPMTEKTARRLMKALEVKPYKIKL